MSKNNSIPVFLHARHSTDQRGISMSDNRKRALFIGPKFSTYYYGRFSRIDQSNSVSGFNLGAFFFGFLWFFYRKMYFYGGLVFLLILFLGAVCTFLEIRQVLLLLPVSIGVGIYANNIYKVFVDQKIRKIADLQVKDLERKLIRCGRTSIFAACIIGLLVAVLFSFIL